MDILFFDVDGTLLDSFDGIKYSLKIAIEPFGLTLPNDKLLRNFIGPPIEKSIQKYYSLDTITAIEIAEIFQDIYSKEGFKRAHLYDNVENLLSFCDNYEKYVVTNKSFLYAEKMLNYFGILNYFMEVLCTNRKNSIDKNMLINQKLKCYTNVYSATMIGDTVEDYEAAKNNNCNFIGVTYGFGFQPDINYIFPTCNNIIEIKNKLL